MHGHVELTMKLFKSLPILLSVTVTTHFSLKWISHHVRNGNGKFSFLFFFLFIISLVWCIDQFHILWTIQKKQICQFIETNHKKLQGSYNWEYNHRFLKGFFSTCNSQFADHFSRHWSHSFELLAACSLGICNLRYTSALLPKKEVWRSSS